MIKTQVNTGSKSFLSTTMISMISEIALTLSWERLLRPQWIQCVRGGSPLDESCRLFEGKSSVSRTKLHMEVLQACVNVVEERLHASVLTLHRYLCRSASCFLMLSQVVNKDMSTFILALLEILGDIKYFLIVLVVGKTFHVLSSNCRSAVLLSLSLFLLQNLPTFFLYMANNTASLSLKKSSSCSGIWLTWLSVPKTMEHFASATI